MSQHCHLLMESIQERKTCHIMSLMGYSSVYLSFPSSSNEQFTCTQCSVSQDRWTVMPPLSIYHIYTCLYRTDDRDKEEERQKQRHRDRDRDTESKQRQNIHLPDGKHPIGDCESKKGQKCSDLCKLEQNLSSKISFQVTSDPRILAKGKPSFNTETNIRISYIYEDLIGETEKCWQKNKWRKYFSKQKNEIWRT